MKKILFISAFVFCLCLFAACGSSGNAGSDETDAEATLETNEEIESNGGEETTSPAKEEPARLSEEEKAKYFKVVEFELPEGDFRDVIVEEMRKYASLEWTAAENFSMNEIIGNNDWTVALDYKKGTKYTGLPYTNYFVNYDTFTGLLVDGTFTSGGKGWRTAPGMDCWSAVRCAVQQFEPLEGWTADWVPGRDTFALEMVGTYKASKDAISTNAICQENGRDTMYEAYMSLKKGDIVYRKSFDKKDYLHIRVVVEEPTIVKTAAGKIIPSRSYVKTIEQTNAFDATRSDGVKTNWYVDHQYSLDSLYDTGYVPIRPKSYSKSIGEMEVPYIVLDNEITPSVLSKGAFSSAVKSNFPLRFVTVEIFDKDGNSVVHDEQGGLQDVFSYSLRKYFTDTFKGLAHGEQYTFVLTSGIARGNAELARVEFTYN
ncbi:MAG: hypothetical protein E7615_00565 [Ruminococcaceae bacterium]|nr:hypothetical protein [Oscillospiraceae bacterium]